MLLEMHKSNDVDRKRRDALDLCGSAVGIRLGCCCLTGVDLVPGKPLSRFGNARAAVVRLTVVNCEHPEIGSKDCSKFERLYHLRYWKRKHGLPSWHREKGRSLGGKLHLLLSVPETVMKAPTDRVW